MPDELLSQSIEDLPTYIDLMLINADIGLLLVEEPALTHPAVVKVCKEASAILVNSKRVHCIAHYRRSNNQTWAPTDPRLSTPEDWIISSNGTADK